jgi:hypothetical protein
MLRTIEAMDRYRFKPALLLSCCNAVPIRSLEVMQTACRNKAAPVPGWLLAYNLLIPQFLPTSAGTREETHFGMGASPINRMVRDHPPNG